MRLWSFHPGYLDTKGLVAVWREALLAQQVLSDSTKGYRHHPQLQRFRSTKDPVGSVAEYLLSIHLEATRRGYNFDRKRIRQKDFKGRITCTRGQLLYEWDHLKSKLLLRDRKQYDVIAHLKMPEPNPLFEIIEGDVESWEKRGEVETWGKKVRWRLGEKR